MESSQDKVLLMKIQQKFFLILIQQFNKPGTPQEIVDIKLYLNPISIDGYEALLNIHSSKDQFKDQVTFEPLYIFKNLREEYSSNFLEQKCYYQGSYCVIDDTTLDFASVLNEAIRQKCLWNLTMQSSQEIWWNYVKKFATCIRQKVQNSQQLDCSEQIIYELGLERLLQEDINQCMKNSFVDPDNKFLEDNKVLSLDAEQYPDNIMYTIPLITLNGNLLRETWTTDIITSAICDQLISPPLLCDHIIPISSFKSKEDSNFGLFVILFFSGLFILSLIIFLVKKFMNYSIKQEVDDVIKNHVEEYLKNSQSQISAN